MFRSVTVALLATFVVLGPVVIVRSASAGVTGYAEPAYTKTSANNTFWWAWTAVDGLDSNGNTNYHCLTTNRNNIPIESSNGTNGPGSLNCTTPLRNGPTPSSGNAAYAPLTARSVLENGATYQMCANDWRPNVFVWASGLSSCPSTTIGRDSPSITVSVNGTATYTNNPNLALRIDDSDPTSPPWFSSTAGLGSNWTCITRGATCVPGPAPEPRSEDGLDAGFSRREQGGRGIRTLGTA